MLLVTSESGETSLLLRLRRGSHAISMVMGVKCMTSTRLTCMEMASLAGARKSSSLLSRDHPRRELDRNKVNTQGGK